MSLLALLPSPLLGASVWQPVAAALGDLAWSAKAVATSGAPPSSSKAAMDAFLLALPEDQDLVLVPHSNAGLYAPAVAAERPVSAIVFVDASLPPLLAGVAPVVPAEFFEFLAARADGNEMLPPWTEWWEDEEVAALFPDGQTRNRVEREQTRLPLSYFRDSVLVPPGWDRCPCAYLAFGRTYEAQTTAARDLGWPVRVLPGEHLEMLVHPEVVAEAIVDLLQSATRREIGH